jgi:hypothetical protein
MEPKQPDNPMDLKSSSPAHHEVPVAEKWIPVPSPLATKYPLSPSPNDAKKTISTSEPHLAMSSGSEKQDTGSTFMLHPSDQELKQKLPTAASEVGNINRFDIGFAPVDIHGKLLLDLKNTGGWRAALFIFGMCIWR